MRRVLRPQVEPELRRDARWYEERRPSLGRAFLEEVEKTLDQIDENPSLYQQVHLDIRRAPLRRFPYSVYFVPLENELHVLAIVHDSRHPSRWRRRR